VIKEEDSIVLKRLIRELSSDTTRISEIREKKGLHRESVRVAEDSRIFFDLYLFLRVFSHYYCINKQSC